MMRLYELRNDYEEIFAHMNEFVDENGEISEDFINIIDNIKDDIKDKSISVAVYIKKLEVESEAYKSEIKRLTDEKRRIDKSIEWYKVYLTNAMQTAQIDNIKDIKANITFRKSEKIEIADEFKIPLKFQKVTYTPDKTLLKQAIKDGKRFKGVKLVETNNIQIK